MHGRLGTGARVRFAREARPKSALRSLAFYPTKLLLVGRRQWEAKGGRGMPHVHMIGKDNSCHRSLPDTPCQRIVSMYTVSSKSLLGTPCQHSLQAQAPSTYQRGSGGAKPTRGERYVPVGGPWAPQRLRRPLRTRRLRNVQLVEGHVCDTYLPHGERPPHRRYGWYVALGAPRCCYSSAVRLTRCRRCAAASLA